VSHTAAVIIVIASINHASFVVHSQLHNHPAKRREMWQLFETTPAGVGALWWIEHRRRLYCYHPRLVKNQCARASTFSPAKLFSVDSSGGGVAKITPAEKQTDANVLKFNGRVSLKRK
jgi:hypothetical protein